MTNYTKKGTNKRGDVFYYNDKDQYHRLDGPAVEWADGDKYWYVDGKLHCLDGPAVEYADGYKAWWADGKRHRLDGPAIEYADGGKVWYVNDEYLTESEFKKHPLVVEKMLGRLIGEVLND